MDSNRLEGTKFEGIVKSSRPGTLGYWETMIKTSEDQTIALGTFENWESGTQVGGTIERTKSVPISFLVSHDIKERSREG